MGVGDPQPTGEARFYRELRLPVSAVNDRGEDVTSSVQAVDGAAAPVGEVDRRFIGRLAREHVLTMRFETPLPARDGQAVLIIDGWVEYPYSQTMFAAWQAGAAYDAPTVEARTLRGKWVTLLSRFGYPAGMMRQMSVPLPLGRLADEPIELRIRTSQEIYWDRIALALAEACPEAARHALPPAAARLARVGFARHIEGPQRRHSFDYTRRDPHWDARIQRGQYTAFGPVDELLARADDAVAIFGPGEELHMEFAATSLPPQRGAGWTRRYVLEARGWCKDMDLFTQHGETIEPLPTRGAAASPARDALHQRYHTRDDGGR
jgi:hypothetical protein